MNAPVYSPLWLFDLLDNQGRQLFINGAKAAVKRQIDHIDEILEVMRQSVRDGFTAAVSDLVEEKLPLTVCSAKTSLVIRLDRPGYGDLIAEDPRDFFRLLASPVDMDLGVLARRMRTQFEMALRQRQLIASITESGHIVIDPADIVETLAL